jgi:hypothetical protein
MRRTEIVYPPDRNILAACDVLYGNKASLGRCSLLSRTQTLISRRFFVLLRLFCAFASHAVLPYLGLVGSFVGADAVRFNLAGVQRCATVVCIAQSEVVRRRKIFILGTSGAVNWCWLILS